MNVVDNYQGLVDDGIYGYELRSPQSYLRYGYESSTNIFYLYNIGTPNADDRNKGHAKFLLHIFFQKIKKSGGTLNHGNYTKSGELYIKPVIDHFSKQYNIRIIHDRD